MTHSQNDIYRQDLAAPHPTNRISDSLCYTLSKIPHNISDDDQQHIHQMVRYIRMRVHYDNVGKLRNKKVMLKQANTCLNTLRLFIYDRQHENWSDIPKHVI